MDAIYLWYALCIVVVSNVASAAVYAPNWVTSDLPAVGQKTVAQVA